MYEKNDSRSSHVAEGEGVGGLEEGQKDVLVLAKWMLRLHAIVEAVQCSIMQLAIFFCIFLAVEKP